MGTERPSEMTHKAQSSVFLVTKPLQLLVALAVIDDYRYEKNTVEFFIVDDFFKARQVADKLGRVTDHKVTLFNDHKRAFDAIGKGRFERVFIDSDVGVYRFVQLALLKLSPCRPAIFVYEEGIGTYRTDIYGGFKKLALSKVGVGVTFGGCLFVSGVYVFSREKYLSRISYKKAVYAIPTSIANLIDRHRSSLYLIFGISALTLTGAISRARSCVVYLSSWFDSSDSIDELFDYKHDLFVKLHPHIKSIGPKISRAGANLVDNHVPAELLLDALVNRYEAVKVFHHGSSVCDYVSHPKVIFVRV